MLLGYSLTLKKHFCTINHQILINKLEQYGIRGLAPQWVQSYLRNRKQFVKMGDCQSECLNIVCGVPQGSVLGPKFFILISMTYVKYLKNSNSFYLLMTQTYLALVRNCSNSWTISLLNSSKSNTGLTKTSCH